MAPADTWQEFEGRWNAVLRSAGLSWFHAVDFAYFKDDFEAWRSEGDKRRIDLSRALLATVPTGLKAPTPIAAILSTADFKSLPAETRSCMRNEPYLHCFQAVARGVALEAKYEAPRERASAVFAESQYSGRARELWAALRSLPNEHQAWYGDIEFDSPRSHPALQLADWFAYEVHQEFKRQRGRKKQSKPRKPFDAFWKMCQPAPLVRYFSRSDLIECYAEGLRQFRLRRKGNV